MTSAQSRFGVPPRLAYDVVEEQGDGPLQIYLRHVPGGPNYAMDGSAAMIWWLASEGTDVVTELADLTGERAEDIADHVRDYLDDLVEQGLLERH